MESRIQVLTVCIGFVDGSFNYYLGQKLRIKTEI